MNHCGIYCLESPDGEIYIGQSRNIRNRVNVYKRNNKLTQPKLKASLDKHGYANHKVYVLAHLPKDVDQYSLDVSEKAYIKLFKDMGKPMLNIKSGGGAPMYGKTHSEALKNKFREMYKGDGNPNYGKGLFLSKNGRARAILQYDMNMNFIKEWDCVTSASNELGIKRTTISSNLNGYNKSAKGFLWRYKV